LDTVLYLYYGNGSCDSQELVEAVWDDDFVGVWHKGDNTSVSICDSTIHHNDGSKKAVGEPVEGDGQVGKAQVYDDDYVSLGQDQIGPLLDGRSGITVSAWVNGSDLSGWNTIFYEVVHGDYVCLMFRVQDGRVRIEARSQTGDVIQVLDSVATLDVDTWYYVMAVVDYAGEYLRLFIDGDLDNETGVSWGSSTYVHGVPTIETWMGDHPTSGRDFTGVIDEVRISSIARSADWIETEYINQYMPDSFFAVGVEESVSGDVDVPVISDVICVMSDPMDTVIGWENISCTVTDNLDIHTVWVNITYPDTHMDNISMIKIGDVFYYNATFSEEGSYSYFIWANDTSDNRNMSGVEGFVLPPNWDITGNGVCNGLDVTPISLNWLAGDGTKHGWIRADINNDGWVNGLDVTFISVHWLETWL